MCNVVRPLLVAFYDPQCHTGMGILYPPIPEDIGSYMRASVCTFFVLHFPAKGLLVWER
jgi:hypothetical protein